MPLADAWNKYKDGWMEKLVTAKGPHLGRSLVVEVPVDATSKIGVPTYAYAFTPRFKWKFSN
ncbi:protein of unknown function [Limnospira indica PCC 8005]|uniref:Uncharacterized protein n=1 Tax=Limnospira indica PCC 8005 TaxID=376219 RepID=A0A9P1KBC7_9CYAN|nr:protein of unknown function [Limnospira indica PCC 8005]